MAKIKEELFNTLQDLTENEFKVFKWYLQQRDILEGFKSISVAQLDEAKRQETVDLMVQNHQDPGALQLTMKVLEKMNRNDLMQHLQNLHPELKGPGPAETQSVPADMKLMSVRTQFIDKVSEPVLRQLLDKLLERQVINDGEMEFAGTSNRAEKARQVIDMVRRKGREASSALIAALCEVDPFLSKQLKLQ